MTLRKIQVPLKMQFGSGQSPVLTNALIAHQKEITDQASNGTRLVPSAAGFGDGAKPVTLIASAGAV